MDEFCENPCENCPRNRGVICGAGVFLVAVVLFALSWDTVEPTQYGMVQNGFTGYVDLNPDNVYSGGRYFIWLRHQFITFPRNLVNLEFDFDGGDRAPIPARTGPDPDDPDTGGQPIALSVSFQYRIKKRDVPRIYAKFGLLYDSSYMRFAQQAITNMAQSFTPRAFWTDRYAIEKALLGAVNRTLIKEGFAEVLELQLLKVDFSRDYETTITNIQLQEQLKVTKTYKLDVTRVLKEVDILESKTRADIARINAQAQREASVLVNEAEAQALRLEQTTKATWYKQLKTSLGWTNADFLKYVKIKSLDKQQSDNMVVGVSALG